MTTSINTNTAAYVALQSLNATSTALTATQKQISTGYRVNDALDDGAAFAVAQQVRSDVGALTTVNQQLGHASGVIGVANTALTDISSQLISAKSTLTDIADGSNSPAQVQQYVASFNKIVSAVADDVDNSSTGGISLLGSVAGTPTAGANVTVLTNENGGTTTFNGQDNSTTAQQLAALIGETFSRSATGVDTFTGGPSGATPTTASLTAAQTAATTALEAGGTFDALQTTNGNQLNQIGIDSGFLNSQQTFNSNKIDSLNTGLGALVDANLSQESAVLQSLQIKQQLGTQALSIANQAPQALLSLFK